MRGPPPALAAPAAWPVAPGDGPRAPGRHVARNAIPCAGGAPADSRRVAAGRHPQGRAARPERARAPVAAAPHDGITDNVSPRPGVPGSTRIEVLAPHSR